MMKFLDLNTGYSFDALWEDKHSTSDWEIQQYVPEKTCTVCGFTISGNNIDELLNNDSIDLLFSEYEWKPGSPDDASDSWTSSLTENTKWIASRSYALQSKGYIFWFPNEQSTKITHTMTICALTDNDAPIELSIEDNTVFSFIAHSDAETLVDGYVFNAPSYSKDFITVPEKVGDYYAHIINIAGCSDSQGEYVCKVHLGDYGYIRIGADFYGEYEPVYINLSNFGVEIPETIQKAIYDANVHEDFKDNILINRKFKELLSNYWDIIANRGSYKSLSNSLEWFEWGDELKIKEIWKRDEAGRFIFDDRDILSIFENKIEDSFENFIKTTYVSLYCALYEELPKYDSEFNPEISKAVLKWSRNDIQLKIALLAQFFGAFFLPIHMQILHATAEDEVFTNTIKTIHAHCSKRDDCFGDFNYIECSVPDDKTYKMTNVRAQVKKDTRFGVHYGQSDTDAYFGVNEFPSNGKIDIHTFSNQYYSGPGVIIPIKLTIPNQAAGDFIRQTVIDYNYLSGKERRLYFYDVIYSRGGKFTIDFNFLAKAAMDYSIRFTFITGSGKTITRTVKFTVEDADNLNINIYKVQAKDDSDGLTMEQFLDTSNLQYFFRVQDTDNPSYYTQYLPYMDPTDALYKDYKGIKLNRTVVVKLIDDEGNRLYSDYEILVLQGLMDDTFLEFAKYKYETDEEGNYVRDENGKLKPLYMTYLIFVSKQFYGVIPQEIIDKKYEIIRNDLGFYPQFHDLVLMTGINEDNYTVSQYEGVCCAAEINKGSSVERFRWGHLINTAEWTFYNPATLETIEHPASSRVPFVTKTDNALKAGYYDISFKYSLTNGVTGECRLDSGFRVKEIKR